jgi:hypothetical protein
LIVHRQVVLQGNYRLKAINGEIVKREPAIDPEISSRRRICRSHFEGSPGDAFIPAIGNMNILMAEP